MSSDPTEAPPSDHAAAEDADPDRVASDVR